MKNIFAKIAKPLLIPALALSMNLKNADAQKLEFNPGFYIGGSATNYSNLKIYDDWKTHFKGLSGDEVLKYKKIRGHFNFQPALDLGIAFKNFSFGLNVGYSVSEAVKEKTLSSIDINNWHYNYARIREASLKQKTPSLGVYLKFPTREGGKVCLRGSARKVDINEIKREDINLNPPSKCDTTPIDDTKNSTKEFERTECKTLLNKIGLEYQSPVEEGLSGFGLYYETDWKRVHELGANLSLYFNLPEKKKDP
jgi:hypothetical protein